MEKEGKIMSEEKKNLTEEEKKELKENLKKQVDELSDEELDNVAGGYVTDDNGDFLCIYCGKTFKNTGGILSKMSYVGHVQTHTQGIHAVYKYCDICGYGSITEYQHNYHMKTQHNK